MLILLISTCIIYHYYHYLSLERIFNDYLLKVFLEAGNIKTQAQRLMYEDVWMYRVWRPVCAWRMARVRVKSISGWNGMMSSFRTIFERFRTSPSQFDEAESSGEERRRAVADAKTSTVSKKTNTIRVQSIPPVTLKGLHKKLWKFLFSTCLPTHIQIHHTYQYISHYVFTLLPIHFQCFFHRCFWAFKGVFQG